MKLRNELNSMCAQFWWGNIGHDHKIHWMRWEKLTLPKSEGSMGFRDFRSFNLAVLAKQGCQLSQELDSLLFKCFKARYFPRGHFLDA